MDSLARFYMDALLGLAVLALLAYSKLEESRARKKDRIADLREAPMMRALGRKNARC